MATIGLDKLYYASITEDANGEETYGTPTVLAKAMTAELSIELNEAILYADDGAAEVVKEFKSGTLSLGVDDIGASVASALTGATIDTNGVVVSASEDGGNPVAVGFRAKKSNGKYRYFWLYRVKFGVPATNLQTKGDSISFSTPTIEGTILQRNKVYTYWSEKDLKLTGIENATRKFFVRIKGKRSECEGKIKDEFGDVTFIEIDEDPEGFGFITSPVAEGSFEEHLKNIPGVMGRIRFEEN